MTETDARATRGDGAWVPPFELGAGEDLGYDEAIARIEAARSLGIDPSLEPIRALLDALGHPERHYRSVQVAGTNGKTSTSRYTAALLRASGLRTGLYTSPHLVRYEERVEVDGAVTSPGAFARGLSWALAAWERVRATRPEVAARGCTEFELLTAAALAQFAIAGVDVAVLEVGLGGRWDATTAVRTCACAITGIGLDHTAILGDTLAAIAGEKAGVIHAGAPVVLGTNAIRPPEVADVMRERCARAGVTPRIVVDEGDVAGLPAWMRDLPRATFAQTHRPQGLGDEMGLRVRLVTPATGEGRAWEGIRLIAPSYQAQNVACALALASEVTEVPAPAARAAIASCPTPGRFEVVSREPLVILDACHNPQSAEAFASAVRDAQPDRALRPTLLFGALADKDHRGIARVVAPLFDDIVVTQSDSERALPAATLAREVAEVTGREPRVFARAQDALAALRGKPFVCCGTITLIGEIDGLLR